ncbi:cell polarity determinant GTPase MglA [Desulfoluna limicola]|uniref:Cell polarity determinant GTPase MglA n=1 Tax=Desulfoluna limicola TaxID=2810562 RepID=A0ABM7PDT3_9BACT|nr:GTPase domain-containing protein [Desulfoluna limicola]BCS95792.1 cell polarity determinant GTPase MglA [Desulfoluna limicola]
MALINPKKREVQVKIVYYGPGRGGKTTNLEYINEKFRSRIKSEMVTVKTYNDRTLFFDFLPFDIGMIKGYTIKVQFYTVPGQVKYNATRKLVLRGVDGIVFVADSMTLRQEMNIRSLENLAENLTSFNKSIDTIPLVMQYNKRDLEQEGIPILPVDVMEKDLNAKLKAPYYTASAVAGDNVALTMKRIISMTVMSIREKLELGGND